MSVEVCVVCVNESTYNDHWFILSYHCSNGRSFQLYTFNDNGAEFKLEIGGGGGDVRT